MQLSARIFTALAVLTLLVAYVAGGGASSSVKAATGTIDVVNVGTCYTTDAEVLDVDDCDDGNNATTGYSVAGRDEEVQTDQIYATYAVDPKTSAESPRAILENSDLLKISINDTGRDKRTSVIIRVGSAPPNTPDPGSPIDSDSENTGSGNDYEDAMEFIFAEAIEDKKITDEDSEFGGATKGPNGFLSRETRGQRFAITNQGDRWQTRTAWQWGDLPGGDGTGPERLFSHAVLERGLNTLQIIKPDHAQFRDGNGNDYEEFKPMSVDDAKPNIRFYGYLVDGRRAVVGSPQDLSNDGYTLADFQDDDGNFEIINLKDYVTLDEDRAPGSADADVVDEPALAPWMNVQASIPNDRMIVLRYILYETSEREELVGTGKYDRTADDGSYAAGTNGNPDPTNDDGNDATDDTPAVPVAFTKDEREDGDALIVRVESDGVESSQNLWLRETGRFTSTYEGYVRLTDANGDGTQNCNDVYTQAEADEDPDLNAGDPKQSENWGRKVCDAQSPILADGADEEERMVNAAAVLGVESAPVTIRYKDSDGVERTFSVSIDTSTPSVQIDQPAHKAPIQDTTPQFVGSFTDGESGLLDESFRLYVDSKRDDDENGVSGRAVLDIRLHDDPDEDPQPQGFKFGSVSSSRTVDGDEKVEIIADYIGYNGVDAPFDGLFGVLNESDIYKLDDEIGDGNTKEVESENFDDGDSSGTFRDSTRVNFRDEEVNRNGYNHAIDFQAFVIDRAGNIGFSDSDATGPTFINDLGTEESKRKSDRYNVLGWYARHIFSLDEKDPEIFKDRSATGFFGENDDDEAVADRSGIMLVFDGAIDADSIETSTFTVTLDEDEDGNESEVAVADVDVQGRNIYLLLASELASDATPEVDLADGKRIQDPAGNITSHHAFDPVEINDGISPVFTVTLSEGTGTGTGKESASDLTKGAITVTVSSDEAVQGAPSITVTCSNIEWDKDSDNTDLVLKDFVGERDGASTNGNANLFVPLPVTDVTCDDDNDDTDDNKKLRIEPAYARPGNNWEYQWKNSDTLVNKLTDGKLTVVAFGRDKNSYKRLKAEPANDNDTDDVYNWGAATAEFRLDTDLKDPSRSGTDPDKERVRPSDGTTITEPQPFILVEFDDPSTVSINKFQLDDTELPLQDPGDNTPFVQSLGDNRFLYFPQTLAVGDHKVTVEAEDAAGNTEDFDYEFKIKQLGEFKLELLAGWNAISFPANPVDRTLGAVFTAPEIDQVIAWDAETPQSPWRFATKIDGVWSTSPDYGTLETVEAQYGYWVHATTFLDQAVQLVGKARRSEAANAPADPSSIPTIKGWNFVGVIDQDGDQIEDSFGETLMNSKTDDEGNNIEVDAETYLGDYARAYTWDPIRSRFEDLDEDAKIKIGDGVWVYFPEGFNIGP